MAESSREASERKITVPKHLQGYVHGLGQNLSDEAAASSALPESEVRVAMFLPRVSFKVVKQALHRLWSPRLHLQGMSLQRLAAQQPDLLQPQSRASRLHQKKRCRYDALWSRRSQSYAAA